MFFHSLDFCPALFFRQGREAILWLGIGVLKLKSEWGGAEEKLKVLLCCRPPPTRTHTRTHTQFVENGVLKQTQKHVERNGWWDGKKLECKF